MPRKIRTPVLADTEENRREIWELAKRGYTLPEVAASMGEDMDRLREAFTEHPRFRTAYRKGLLVWRRAVVKAMEETAFDVDHPRSAQMLMHISKARLGYGDKPDEMQVPLPGEMGRAAAATWMELAERAREELDDHTTFRRPEDSASQFAYHADREGEGEGDEPPEDDEE